MLTEDPFRRRELADLDIKAEVTGDGHTIVATFDRPQFDALLNLARSTDTEIDLSDDELQESYEDGYRAGVADTKAAQGKAAPAS